MSLITILLLLCFIEVQFAVILAILAYFRGSSTAPYTLEAYEESEEDRELERDLRKAEIKALEARRGNKITTFEQGAEVFDELSSI